MANKYAVLTFLENTMTKKDQIEKAWNNAKKVNGKDPQTYRANPYGNPIYKPSYGKSSPMGWELDHIQPKSRGGSDLNNNMQAMNTSVNR